MAILSFNGRVNIAVNKVLEKYPDAALFEAAGGCSQGFANEPKDLDIIKVVFYKPEYSHIIIESTGYAEFGEPELIEDMWVGDVILNWQDIEMDLNEAHELKAAAGYTGPYRNVALREPLGPVPVNPYFIFGSGPRDPFIFVDTVTKEVFEAYLDKNIKARV